VSDTWVAPGWWLASDGRWYPPATAECDTVGADTNGIERDVDAHVVLDLRTSEPVIELEAKPAMTPPPIPAPAARPASAHGRSRDGGGTRWGGHRRIAPPIGTSPAD